MKTPMFFLMAVCTVLSYAQTGSEMSTTNKSSTATLNTQVTPYPLEVTYDKTTHLIFPSAIRYVDLGSEHLIADKAKEAENVLRVKAAVTDFEQKTNLSVITEDGGFFSFEVCYHPSPKLLTLDFARNIPQGNSVKSDILFSDTGWESPAVAQMIMTSIYNQKREFIKHIGSQNAGISWLLKGMYVHNGKLYLDIKLKNRSRMPFEVDFISFKMVDKKTTKQSLVQEISIEPLRMYQPLLVVKPKKDARCIYMLEGFTLSDDKVLRIEIFEKKGSRYQSFLLTNEDISKSRPIEQFHLKF